MKKVNAYTLSLFAEFIAPHRSPCSKINVLAEDRTTRASASIWDPVTVFGMIYRRIFCKIKRTMRVATETGWGRGAMLFRASLIENNRSKRTRRPVKIRKLNRRRSDPVRYCQNTILNRVIAIVADEIVLLARSYAIRR